MNHQKLDYGLLAIVDLVERQQPLSEFNAFAMVMAVGAGPDGDQPLAVVVFLHFTDLDTLNELVSQGLVLGGGRGTIRSATVSVSSLGALSEVAGVEQISAARRLNPQMDMALSRTGLLRFRVEQALSGAGVVIGIVDSGIDVSTRAFAGRVHSIWDQKLPGPGVPEGAYGTELRDASMLSSLDETGHGTHVACIAAGKDATYGGVAPEATLVIVKTERIDARVADAISYIFRIASEAGMPAVVNLSLGAHWDQHDGTDALSRVIDTESGPGRIVVTAAGNDGYQDVHARSDVLRGSTVEFFFRVPPLTINIVTINLWYSAVASLEVSVQTPGDFYTPWQPPIGSGNPQRLYDLTEGRIRVTTHGRKADNTDLQATVELTALLFGNAIPHGLWRVRLRNASAVDATVDAWVMDDFGQVVVFSGQCVHDGMKVGSPGCARRAITVASYTSKVRWEDVQGTEREVALKLDDISDFSSPGPLRNGLEKPDVAAPGAMVVAARSSQSQADPNLLTEPGWIIRAGTSMAAPVVTGMVALMLQRDPSLDPEAIKARLRQLSRIPDKPPETYDPKWGYGLLQL